MLKSSVIKYVFPLFLEDKIVSLFKTDIVQIKHLLIFCYKILTLSKIDQNIGLNL